MFDTEEEELEINPDDVSSEDSLLYSHFAGPRLFILNDLEKTNVWAVLLEESDDSFLVGLPAKITQVEGNVTVEAFMPVPYTRLMKSAILNVSYTFGAWHQLYMDYVDGKGVELYPEIAEYIEEDTTLESEPAESTIINSTDVDLSLSKDAEEGNQVQGMTDEELLEYLQDKYNIGELASGSRKKQ